MRNLRSATRSGFIATFSGRGEDEVGPDRQTRATRLACGADAIAYVRRVLGLRALASRWIWGNHVGGFVTLQRITRFFTQESCRNGAVARLSWPDCVEKLLSKYRAARSRNVGGWFRDCRIPIPAVSMARICLGHVAVIESVWARRRDFSFKSGVAASMARVARRVTRHFGNVLATLLTDRFDRDRLERRLSCQRLEDSSERHVLKQLTWVTRSHASARVPACGRDGDGPLWTRSGTRGHTGRRPLSLPSARSSSSGSDP